MQAKIKDQQKGKQSNKQSLVRPNKVSLVESPSCHGAARRRLATVEALCRASWWGVLCIGKSFGFNHKIMINV